VSKKAVLLVTVHRRYHELVENLKRLRERAPVELGYQPDVVLVWSSPELSRLWLMQDLLAKGWVAHLLQRPPLPGEGLGAASTIYESHNLRMGLSFIRDHYGGEHYAVGMAADVYLQDESLSFIDSRMNGRCEEGPQNAVVFHWVNGCTHSGVWHTNFFGVCLDDRYWPPLSPANEQDVLERQWGRSLEAAHPPGVFRWHNSGDRRFLHRHTSEALPEFPHKPQKASESLALACKGWLPWYSRLWQYLTDKWIAMVDWLSRPVWRQE
jgi:hypothetical protein